mgnify:CR=1 FL=1
MPFPHFYLIQKEVYAIPILPYKMEMACLVKLALEEIKPDCIAVELPETIQPQACQAARRLPNLSVILVEKESGPSYIMCEPCDPIFEGLRSAVEKGIDAFCIDLALYDYPEIKESLPDSYAAPKIGLKTYFESYEKASAKQPFKSSVFDQKRELHMAKRLKELSLRYDKILFIGGMAHVSAVLKLINNSHFPTFTPVIEEDITLLAPCSTSYRQIMAEWGYLSLCYEKWRSSFSLQNLPDRQVIIFHLFKEASLEYQKSHAGQFFSYHLKNLMQFSRRYAAIHHQLMPDLFKILHAAKGCVDSNYAYETWQLATDYPYQTNIDHLPTASLTAQQVWGDQQRMRFELKKKSSKSNPVSLLKKDRSSFSFSPHPFSICSYPPEDLLIEKFGHFLKQKAARLLKESAAKTIPFSTSFEEGIDVKETIRQWHKGGLFVKTTDHFSDEISSLCIIFEEEKKSQEPSKYPWCTTWLGEHAQESDMAFFATPLGENIIGPGISRCEYGGLLLSSPPRRMRDIWTDSDYLHCEYKAEKLLMAAIDYAVHPTVVYVASFPPKEKFKRFAKSYGKKIVYLPLGQLSVANLNKLRLFHVLDSHHRREIAGDYIY